MVRQTIHTLGNPGGGGRLDVIPSGSRVANPAELLFGGPLNTVLNSLGTLKYDYVIIDGPPLLAIADAHALAQHADTVLLAARPDRLTLDQG
jgi:tyrosine-protein kinase Etk/Wzc